MNQLFADGITVWGPETAAFFLKDTEVKKFQANNKTYTGFLSMLPPFHPI